MTNDDGTITKTVVPDDKRIARAAEVFGIAWPLRVEPSVFRFGEMLSVDYRGGYWTFFDLSNGGFYAVPPEGRYRVAAPNEYSGAMSADTFGVVVALYAYSHLSFSDKPLLSLTCSEQYHLVRDYAAGHPEADAIFRAID